MTETDHHLSLPPPKPARSMRREMRLLAAAIVIAAALFAAAFLLPASAYRILPMAGFSAPPSQAMTDEEQKIQALDVRLNALAARVDAIESAPPPAMPPPAKLSPSDLAHVQGDLTALSAAVNGMKVEVKRAAETRAQTQTALAETIAFTQLRQTALAGHGFAPELAVMKNTAKNDSAFDDPLGKLAPYAETGAPGIAVLRDRLDGLAGAADQAVAAATAQTWWQRIMAELKGLVSIRPLHSGGTPAGPLEIMLADLARGDLPAALEAAKDLPPEVKTTVEPWRKQAEARRAIDEALHAMADHLIAGAHAASPTPAQDEP